MSSTVLAPVGRRLGRRNELRSSKRRNRWRGRYLLAGTRAHRPSSRRERERLVRQQFTAPFAKPRLCGFVESRGVGARGTDTERERLPPLLERRVLDGDREDRVLDPAQPGRPEELRQTALRSAGQILLALDLRLQLTGRLPEDAERPLTAAVVPDTASADTA